MNKLCCISLVTFFINRFVFVTMTYFFFVPSKHLLDLFGKSFFFNNK